MRKNHLDQKFSIYTTDENKKKLLDMARREDRSLAYIVNKVISEYFEMIEKGLVAAKNPFEDIAVTRKISEAEKELVYNKEEELKQQIEHLENEYKNNIKQVFGVSDTEGIEEF